MACNIARSHVVLVAYKCSGVIQVGDKEDESNGRERQRSEGEGEAR